MVMNLSCSLGCILIRQEEYDKIAPTVSLLHFFHLSLTEFIHRSLVLRFQVLQIPKKWYIDFFIKLLLFSFLNFIVGQ